MRRMPFRLGRQVAVGERPTRGRIAAAVVRLAAAVVFISFGAGKFTSHASELASFRGYGLPSPDAFVYLIGVVEIVGGILLLCGLAIRQASLVLAANMIGAIVVSGIGRGEIVSLTLAPAMLAAMLFLLWHGPGRGRLRRPDDRRPAGGRPGGGGHGAPPADSAM